MTVQTMRRKKFRHFLCSLVLFTLAVALTLGTNRPAPTPAEDGYAGEIFGTAVPETLTYLCESPAPIPESGAATSAAALSAVALTVHNESGYSIDIEKLLEDAAVPAMAQESGSSTDPQVLIVHTHGSESYTSDAEYPYTQTDTDRTTDTRYNVVRVGDALAARLESMGIRCLHLTTLHDFPSYNGAYSRSLETVEAAMEAYPSISVVIDLHRDALVYDDGSRFAAETAQIDGQTCAGVMLVVGTDAGGLQHPHWDENLSFALALQALAQQQCPGLMRPVNLRAARFNQHVSPFALIVEVGASGNTLGQAIAAAEAFGSVLGAYLQR